MYKLKNVAKRGSALVAAVSLLTGIGSSMVPVLVHADALNPLTQRSLLLSSSSPGWAYTDGSGNTTYATPNSGTNGQKSGETFAFKVSTNSTNSGANATNTPVKAFTFQYCTSAAGLCTAPGNDTQTLPTPRVDDPSHTDLNVVTSSPSEVASAGAWSTILARTNNPPTQPNQLAQIPLANNSEGNFVVLVNNVYSGGWSMSTQNLEDGSGPTGKNNYITLTNTTGISPAHNDAIQVVFFATNTNYITNPGAGAFFVKINDYNSATTQNFRANYPTPATPQNVIDGGVTVANIMNESIQIQTKVLETMDFSVGTVDPDTLTPAEYSTATSAARTAHGQCDPILTSASFTGVHNSLYLGKTDAENSLETSKTYATHSYWRLSSNSSGGATVYYSGSTLSNTEGDQIAPIGNTFAAPQTGTPQFGLAIDNATTGNFLVDDASQNTNTKDTGADDSTANKGQLDPTAGVTGWAGYLGTNSAAHNPQLFPLVANANYALGHGTNGIFDSSDGTIDTKFAFDPLANTVPRAIASENSQVVDCVTAKMRYVGNIAATTPAGIYSTRINYLAAPQY